MTNAYVLNARSRWYVFTRFPLCERTEPREETEEDLTLLGEIDALLSLPTMGIIFQEERGAREYKYHLQGTMRFKNQRTGRQVVRMLEAEGLTGGTFIQQCRNPKKSIEYCTKPAGALTPDGDVTTWVGERWQQGDLELHQGERNDLGALLNLIATEDMSIIALAEDNPQLWVQYQRPLEIYRREKQKAKAFRTERNVESIVYWGPADSGKTSKVYLKETTKIQENGYADPEGVLHVYKVPKGDENNPIWWDGYEGQPVLLFDDFYGKKSGLDYGTFLELCDPHQTKPTQLRIKGGFTYSQHVRVYFTSNWIPSRWYPDECLEEGKRHGEMTGAMVKRLQTIEHVVLNAPRLSPQPPANSSPSLPLRSVVATSVSAVSNPTGFVRTTAERRAADAAERRDADVAPTVNSRVTLDGVGYVPHLRIPDRYVIARTYADYDSDEDYQQFARESEESDTDE